MTSFGAASIAATALKTLEETHLDVTKESLTATEMRERIDTAKKGLRDMSMLDSRRYAEMVMADWERQIINPPVITSPPSLQPCEPDMINIVERLTYDRSKLLAKAMHPKHIYLGQRQYSNLKATQEYSHALMTQQPDEPVKFMGFEVYLVQTEEHYVMTGE